MNLNYFYSLIYLRLIPFSVKILNSPKTFFVAVLTFLFFSNGILFSLPSFARAGACEASLKTNKAHDSTWLIHTELIHKLEKLKNHYLYNKKEPNPELAHIVREISNRLVVFDLIYKDHSVQNNLLNHIKKIMHSSRPNEESIRNVLALLSPTQLINKENGKLRGREVPLNKNLTLGHKISREKENNAASFLAQQGFNVVHLGTNKNGKRYTKALKKINKKENLTTEKKPDLILENHIFDIYSPHPSNNHLPLLIARIREKTDGVFWKDFDKKDQEIKGEIQSKRIILNLFNNPNTGNKATIAKLRDALYHPEKYKVETAHNLQELIVLWHDQGTPTWTRAFP